MEIPPRHWRLKRQMYSLVGSICPACDVPSFPPREICPNCTGSIKIDCNKTKGTIFEASQSTSLTLEASKFSK